MCFNTKTGWLLYNILHVNQQIHASWAQAWAHAHDLIKIGFSHPHVLAFQIHLYTYKLIIKSSYKHMHVEGAKGERKVTAVYQTNGCDAFSFDRVLVFLLPQWNAFSNSFLFNKRIPILFVHYQVDFHTSRLCARAAYRMQSVWRSDMLKSLLLLLLLLLLFDVASGRCIFFWRVTQSKCELQRRRKKRNVQSMLCIKRKV